MLQRADIHPSTQHPSPSLDTSYRRENPNVLAKNIAYPWFVPLVLSSLIFCERDVRSVGYESCDLPSRTCCAGGERGRSYRNGSMPANCPAVRNWEAADSIRFRLPCERLHRPPEGVSPPSQLQPSTSGHLIQFGAEHCQSRGGGGKSPMEVMS